MFSQAQLIAEEMVADVSRDARERIGQAREHERRIVEEAVNAAGQQVRTYAHAAQAQMQSIMNSFATEVDALASPSVSRESTPPRQHPNGTALDDASDFQVWVPNTRGPDSHSND
jgi:vacuolar-type H+-ATPase subunit H